MREREKATAENEGHGRRTRKKEFSCKRNRERIVTSRNRMRKEKGLTYKETGE